MWRPHRSRLLTVPAATHGADAPLVGLSIRSVEIVPWRSVQVRSPGRLLDIAFVLSGLGSGLGRCLPTARRAARIGVPVGSVTWDKGPLGSSAAWVA